VSAATPHAAGSNGSRRPERLRLGGMALRNGLLIHGPTAWAAAARAPDGSIEVASGPKPRLARGRLGEVPLVRGPLRLVEALAVVPLSRLRLRSARLPFEDGAVLAATAFSLLVSGVLRRRPPRRRSTVGAGLGEAAIALFGSLPAVVALRDSDLAAYHAVEHKAIAGYEQDADPATVPKEHRRCGSNLIGPLALLSIAAQIVVERTVERPGPLARGAGTLLAAGAAVELFVYAERHPDSPVARAVHGPGYEIQRRFSTREPTPDQLEVGVAALDAILRAEHEAIDIV
jgi:uncharacterized protein YqhQ